MVKIRFSSELKRVTHSDEMLIEVGNTTLRVVIDKIIQQFGSDVERLILDEGEIKRFINIW